MTRTLAKTLLTLLLLLCAQTTLAGKLYRWVDEQGKVHYSDQVPPQYIDLSRDELSDKGLRKQTIPRAKTAEEVAREQELERLRAEQQRLIEKQQAEDRVLLRTFRSEDDILLARDGKLEAIDVMIRVIQSNIRRYQKRLADLQRQAANLERSGKAKPKPLLKNINGTLKSINEAYAAINRREQEKSAINEIFAHDHERFRILKKLAPAPTASSAETKRAQLNLASCDSPQQCRTAWKRTEQFVRRHATTAMQMLGENIIMTKAPTQDDDISITVSQIPDAASDKTLLFMDLFCRETPRGKEYCESEAVQSIRSAFIQQVEGIGGGAE
jgi:hypothetical protein